ncbi:MAG: LLM class flavin-dependent oxidoreductase [Promethearchaeota archaeon]|jgi:alkanesulfonate monooxygenase SsuD/methylene tetrahydromethanopterin reductase-like flavin-dependent oxidoreductase (luciferase family)
MKFGFILSYSSSPVENIFTQAKKAEECGFDTIFYPDHTINFFPGPDKVFDAFSILGALAMVTKSELCTAVSDCHRFHPALMAHKVATLDHISSGRALFGIGAGEKVNVDMYGLSRDKVLTKLREYIELIRQFWDQNKVTKKSEFWGDIKNAFIQLKPIQKSPPIYIAANGPKTRQLTGELGDGWFPIVESHWTYKEHKKEITDAAKKVGRDQNEIDYALQNGVAIDDKNPEAAVKTLDWILNLLLIMTPNKINEIYPSLNLPTNLNVFNFDLNSNFRELLPYREKLPETYLNDAGCAGTTDDVIASLEKYKQAGLTHIALFNYGPDTDKVFERFRDKIIPYFKEDAD